MYRQLFFSKSEKQPLKNWFDHSNNTWTVGRVRPMMQVSFHRKQTSNKNKRRVVNRL